MSSKAEKLADEVIHITRCLFWDRDNVVKAIKKYTREEERTKRCATCKHWSPPTPGGEKLGSCLASSPGILGHSPVTGERLMEAMCDEDRGYLLTSPEFGCVHWEAKG